MNLWEKFEKKNCKLLNSKINIRFTKDVDKNLRNYYLQFIKYLRGKYVFPYPLNIYIKNDYKVKLSDGTMTYGKFFWYYNENKCYIVIPSKIEEWLLEEYTLEEEYKMIMGSLVHELTHYFQNVLYKDQKNNISEKQANYYRYRILDEWGGFDNV